MELVNYVINHAHSICSFELFEIYIELELRECFLRDTCQVTMWCLISSIGFQIFYKDSSTPSPCINLALSQSGFIDLK